MASKYGGEEKEILKGIAKTGGCTSMKTQEIHKINIAVIDIDGEFVAEVKEETKKMKRILKRNDIIPIFTKATASHLNLARYYEKMPSGYLQPERYIYAQFFPSSQLQVMSKKLQLYDIDFNVPLILLRKTGKAKNPLEWPLLHEFGHFLIWRKTKFEIPLIQAIMKTEAQIGTSKYAKPLGMFVKYVELAIFMLPDEINAWRFAFKNVKDKKRLTREWENIFANLIGSAKNFEQNVSFFLSLRALEMFTDTALCSKSLKLKIPKKARELGEKLARYAIKRDLPNYLGTYARVKAIAWCMKNDAAESFRDIIRSFTAQVIKDLSS